MMRDHVTNAYPPAGRRPPAQIRARLDHIRYHTVLHTVQARYAANTDPWSTDALHVCSCGIEKIGKLGHVRLGSSIFDHGLPRRNARREHQICRRPDRGHREREHSTAKSVAGKQKDLAPLSHRSAEPCKAQKMLIDRTHAEIATARCRKASLPESAEHCAKQIGGAANAPRERFRRHHGSYTRIINTDVAVFIKMDPRTEIAQDLQCAKHVTHPRKIAKYATLSR